jgi:hypothetical protein
MRHARAFSVMPTRGAGIHVLFSSRKKRLRNIKPEQLPGPEIDHLHDRCPT